jgi:hypothetical protein
MSDLEFWTEKLKAAERELEAATTRTNGNADVIVPFHEARYTRESPL